MYCVWCRLFSGAFLIALSRHISALRILQQGEYRAYSLLGLQAEVPISDMFEEVKRLDMLDLRSAGYCLDG
ncbi:hypothetical protein PRIPAC_79084 [Pristionchus pacificus]|uniref:Uncharacterized protein n=1 Tax=Pristionchus pacificus TaxID=54126 RepID=A0A2A6BWH4_PRIPA|nr:hypothetical protein PRIPAC_79084 [Pristionchus pacificus]|eukprot:PDM70352.1 hypothetical protein PRIPAC_46598 [Pristionchus pacificus]